MRHPAIFYGLSALLGTGIAFYFSYAMIVPVIFVWIVPFFVFPKSQIRSLIIRLFLTFICGLFLWLHAQEKTHWPSIPPSGIKGRAEIQISSLSVKKTSFGKKWNIQGYLNFISEEGVRYVQLPYTLSSKYKENQPPLQTDRSYVLDGLLKPSSPAQFYLTSNDPEMWIPGQKLWLPNMAGWRFQLKIALKNYLKRCLPDLQSSTFLSGIATGEFDSALMNFELSRFGLQHIMAISGFHFSLISGFFYVLLNLIFSRKIAACFLVFIVSGYFLFLGYSPSIFRAWTAILVLQIGVMLEKTPCALNSLGFALLINLLIDPLIILNLGFQFSFAITAAILLFFASADLFLQKLFQKRQLVDVMSMDLMDQHGYLVLTFFRQALALGIAVNLAALPFSLFYFHKFAWMSVLYNLFFPFLVSISMVLLLLGLGLSFIPFVGEAINHANSLFTRFALNFTSQAPPSFDFYWRISDFPVEALICYLSLLFFAGFLLKFFVEKYHGAKQEFAFL